MLGRASPEEVNTLNPLSVEMVALKFDPGTLVQIIVRVLDFTSVKEGFNAVRIRVIVEMERYPEAFCSNPCC